MYKPGVGEQGNTDFFGTSGQMTGFQLDGKERLGLIIRWRVFQEAFWDLQCTLHNCGNSWLPESTGEKTSFPGASWDLFASYGGTLEKKMGKEGGGRSCREKKNQVGKWKPVFTRPPSDPSHPHLFSNKDDCWPWKKEGGHEPHVCG